jgi:CBS domain containing-hemolysin-like protein
MLDLLIGASLILFAFALVLLNAFFVAAEFSIVKVRQTRVQELSEQGDVRARVAIRILEHLDAYLSATQLGITIASLGLGWIGKPAFARLLEPALRSWGLWSEVVVQSISVAAAFSFITLLHIVVGELVPKSIAIQSAEKVVLWVAIPLWLFYVGLYPILAAFNGVSNATLRLLGFTPAPEGEAAHSELELTMIIERAHGAGRVSSRRAELLRKFLSFPRRTARQIMVPRGEVTYLSLERTLEENLKIIRESGHTRLPLCEKGLDTIIGLLNVKDLIWRAEGPGAADLRALRRDILFVPESKPIEDLLKEFQQRRVHMAIVVDEYGVMSGLVTLEDIIEELVGEIQDEYDEESPAVQTLADGSYRVSGSMSLHDFAQRFGVRVEEAGETTVAGLVLARLGRIARVGDRVHIDGHSLEVTEVHRRRIGAVRLRPEPRVPTDAPAARR